MPLAFERGVGFTQFGKRVGKVARRCVGVKRLENGDALGSNGLQQVNCDLVIEVNFFK